MLWRPLSQVNQSVDDNPRYFSDLRFHVVLMSWSLFYLLSIYRHSFSFTTSCYHIDSRYLFALSVVRLLWAFTTSDLNLYNFVTMFMSCLSKCLATNVDDYLRFRCDMTFDILWTMRVIANNKLGASIESMNKVTRYTIQEYILMIRKKETSLFVMIEV